MNLDGYKSIGTHRVAIYHVKNDVATYLDSFNIECIPYLQVI